jgi:hypothetical protein
MPKAIAGLGLWDTGFVWAHVKWRWRESNVPTTGR